VKDRTVEIAALLQLSSLRISEVLDVRGTDVNMDKNCIRVHGAAVYGEDGKLVHKKENKNQSSTRYVPIIPPLREALEKIELTDDYLVKMRSATVFDQINKVCRECNLPEVGNHGLRHSFASLAYHLQIPEKIAMQIGGWSDYGTMRKIYTHLSQRDINERSEDFTRFFKNKG
jgi:integrase